MLPLPRWWRPTSSQRLPRSNGVAFAEDSGEDSDEDAEPPRPRYERGKGRSNGVAFADDSDEDSDDDAEPPRPRYERRKGRSNGVAFAEDSSDEDAEPPRPRYERLRGPLCIDRLVDVVCKQGARERPWNDDVAPALSLASRPEPATLRSPGVPDGTASWPLASSRPAWMPADLGARPGTAGSARPVQARPPQRKGTVSAAGGLGPGDGGTPQLGRLGEVSGGPAEAWGVDSPKVGEALPGSAGARSVRIEQVIPRVGSPRHGGSPLRRVSGIAELGAPRHGGSPRLANPGRDAKRARCATPRLPSRCCTTPSQRCATPSQRCTTPSQRSVSSASARRPHSHGRPDEERVSCTTMQGVWTVCDVFWNLDRGHTGFVTREDYVQRLGDQPSVERVRVLRRANLERRFRENASPVSLDEMLHLIWPSATAEDKVTMRRWVELRGVFQMFHISSFRGSDLDMRQAFGRLGAGADSVAAAQLVRARLLGWDDACGLARTQELWRHKIDFTEWREWWWPALRATYVSRETVAAMRREEEESAAARKYARTLPSSRRSSARAF